jgi:kelch repeat/BTB domain-containing protein 5/10
MQQSNQAAQLTALMMTPGMSSAHAGDGGTYLYNTDTQEWRSGAPRQFEGNHIGAEVIGNELYLFGGLRSGGNQVQIYNLEEDEWRAGAELPYEAGSAATAYIGGKVYFCGGIRDGAFG